MDEREMTQRPKNVGNKWNRDEVVPEPQGGAHRDYDLAAANLGTALHQNLAKLLQVPVDQLVKKRYKKFRALGNFAEGKSTAASTRS